MTTISIYILHSRFVFVVSFWGPPFSVPTSEERARIYSSDSDEGSDDDKAQRLMKAKKLDSDEVGATSCWTDRGQYAAALRRSASRDFTRSEKNKLFFYKISQVIVH